MNELWRGAVGAFGLSLHALSSAAASPPLAMTEYGPFSIRSNGNGQRSVSTYSIPVRTTAALRVEYRAPASHCSNVRMHVLVDGIEKAKSAAIAPGRSSGIMELGPVIPGTHAVELQAEGVSGGCNTGVLGAWGGSATVWTSQPIRDPSGPIDTVAAGCGGGVTGSGDEISVSRDGTVERRRVSLIAPPQLWRGSVTVKAAERLLARVNEAGLSSAPASSPGEAACHLTLIDGTTEREIRWSVDGGDAPACAKEIFDDVRALGAQAIGR